MAALPLSSSTGLTDLFGRQVTYLRLSVTDRCDLRCVYCMAEDMAFLPRKDLLTIEELYRLAATFIKFGIRKIRITGGEPLARRGIITLFELLQPHIGASLDEVTLTTNGTLLSRFAEPLAKAGVQRINVSLDTLNPVRYEKITRRGDIAHVFNGLEAAQKAGLKVKLNTVAMQGGFLNEVDSLIRFAHGRGMDLTLIEEMPLGLTGHDRYDTHLSLSRLRESLAQRWTLSPLQASTGGPARYVQVEETGGRLGFITPLSCDFCAHCNRVRVGSTGRLYPCMGQTGMVELREILRGCEGGTALTEAIHKAVAGKPEGHNFLIEKNNTRGILRHMSELGG
ncbi:MAG: Cyclic pyranopterin monophosphate synthase [Candidatus Tokpelaia hoelldobleri]|uniref:GTP 3',8-cyclase n=1 Tax=Candidatus Tokpelaia hoelldobleri TaxID=1902579 RepID=A0A1U9JV67_9HYPH|nr:MAG: Cyclic pyranopterin monophosphate synthase [Candidatus Tokpelaia hoelldoblerii]